MGNFRKGDILVGQRRAFDEAYHPIVYISGPREAPLAVVLTHSTSSYCNKELLNIYDGDKSKVQYFVAHLIEKMGDWGPYRKIGELHKEDLSVIEAQAKDFNPMKWSKYEEYAKKGKCPDHRN